MSNENIGINPKATSAVQTNPGLLSEMGTSVAISGVITGFGGLTSAVRNRGAIKALRATNVKGFTKLNNSLKNCGKDVFTRGVELSQNYDAYKECAKKAQKLENMVKRGDLSYWQKFKNLFKKNKLDFSTVQKQSKEATAELIKKQKMVASGKDIIEEGAKLAGKSGTDTAKNLFKSELKNKFVLAITILGAIPRIKDEVIPTFKEKGFVEGLKATGKVVARTAADFVANAGFSAVGRAIGSAIGSVVPGVGSAIGGTFGDVIGSFFSMKLTEKVFDKNKKDETLAKTEVLEGNNSNQTTENSLNQAAEANNNQTAQNNINQATENNNQLQENKQVNNEQMPLNQQAQPEAAENVQNKNYPKEDFETAKAKYSKPEQKAASRPRSAYIRPKNGVYKTEWVNEMKRARSQNRTDYMV